MVVLTGGQKSGRNNEVNVTEVVVGKAGGGGGGVRIHLFQT